MSWLYVYRRFDPTLAMIREKVQSGAIGQVHSVRSSSCYPTPDADEVIKGAGWSPHFQQITDLADSMIL